MTHIRLYFNSISDSIVAAGTRAGSTTHRSGIGTNREAILRDFLTKHLPRRLTANLGGQVISHESNSMSRQIDVLVTNDLGVRFDEDGATLVTAESVAACISVKSVLDTAELNDSLVNLLSVPDPSPSAVSFPYLKGGAYSSFLQRHPTYFIFAYDGFSGKACQEALNKFVKANPKTPFHRLPKAVIVNAKYMITFSVNERTQRDGKRIPANSFHWADASGEDRGFPFCALLSDISSYASWLNHMDTSIYPYFNAGYGFTSGSV
ncbi:DUF6602 domain-containing protein [Pseudoxanthomonas mexicana]